MFNKVVGPQLYLLVYGAPLNSSDNHHEPSQLLNNHV